MTVGGQGIVLANSYKIRIGFLKCQFCVSFELNANYLGKNNFGLALIVTFVCFYPTVKYVIPNIIAVNAGSKGPATYTFYFYFSKLLKHVEGL